MKRNKENPGYHYACIRDRFADEDEDEESLSGIILLNVNNGLPWLHNLLQDSLLELSQWEEEMQRSLIESPDLQKLIDLSEHVLKNSLFILDPSYALLAYSKNYVLDEPLVTSLIETGYHTEETMNLFKNRKRFKAYDETDGLIISEPGLISRYEVVGKWCKYRGTPVAHVVMMCGFVPRSLAQIELFRILTNYINQYFAMKIETNSQLQIYSSFLHDILYGDVKDAHFIAERAKSIRIPYVGVFNIFRIVFEDNSIVLTNRVVKELMDLLPESKVISHNYEIMIMNLYSKEDISNDSSAKIEAIRPLLNKYEALCGVSSKFTSLRDMKHAFIQSTRAQSIGFKIQRLDNLWNFGPTVWEELMVWKDKRVYYYDDVYLYYILHTAKTNSFDIFRNTFYDNAMTKLIEFDQDHKSNLVQVLYCHLISERKATTTGKLLHMHRNNILYHITKIEEILGVSLDDHMVRLKLLLTFYARELEIANKIEAEA